MNMGIFQPAILVYQRVVHEVPTNSIHDAFTFTLHVEDPSSFAHGFCSFTAFFAAICSHPKWKKAGHPLGQIWFLIPDM